MPARIARRLVGNRQEQAQLLDERLRAIIQGIDNQAKLLDVRLKMLVEASKNQSQLINRKLTELTSRLGHQAHPSAQNQPIWTSTRGSRSDSDSSPDAEVQNSGRIAQVTQLSTDRQSGATVRAPVSLACGRVNDLDAFGDVFEGIRPWSGYVEPHFIADFLGMLIDIEFHPMLFTDPNFNAAVVGGGLEQTAVPRLADAKTPADAEAWFEAVDWVVSAREARGRYVMITLGANYGAQAVGAYRALQTVNPLPYKLVAVEPVPGNIEWIRRHMQNNGIDPDQQWIVPLAISDTIEPVFFPVGAPGVGSNNCYSTNEFAARHQYAEEFIASGQSAEALRNLLINNTTGITKRIVAGHDFNAEIKLVSSITLEQLLAPFETIDLLEADIQQSEILVFPPFIELLSRKVRRIHIGTHGEDVHTALHELFSDSGWAIVFSFKPNSKHESSLGNFETNDGVLTVRNPYL
ncbi:MAG: FkbM family methyltransferase [Xanthobacteraceae bacterium]